MKRTSITSTSNQPYLSAPTGVEHPSGTQRRSRAKRTASWAWLLLGAMAVVAAPAVRAAQETPSQTPKQVVENISRAALDTLADTSLSAAQKRAKLQALFDAAADFETVSRLVLARNWSQFDDTQRKEFMVEFRQYLATTYGRNIDTYTEVQTDVIGERPEPRGDYTVKTKITRPNAADVLVDYRLRKKNGVWKIIDVVIEGVSMVGNFRSQFQEVFAKGGATKLIDMLRDKNLNDKPLAPTPSSS